MDAKDLKELPLKEEGGVARDLSYYALFQFYLDKMRDFRDLVDTRRRAESAEEEPSSSEDGDTSVAVAEAASCRNFRRATMPFLKFMRVHGLTLGRLLGDKRLSGKLQTLVEKLKPICRF